MRLKIGLGRRGKALNEPCTYQQFGIPGSKSQTPFSEKNGPGAGAETPKPETSWWNLLSRTTDQFLLLFLSPNSLPFSPNRHKVVTHQQWRPSPPGSGGSSSRPRRPRGSSSATNASDKLLPGACPRASSTSSGRDPTPMRRS